MAEAPDHFGLQSFDVNSSLEDVEENLLSFSERYISDEADCAIRHLMLPNTSDKVVFEVLENLGFSLPQDIDVSTDDCADFLDGLNINELELDLNTLLRKIFVNIHGESPEGSTSLDNSDSLQGARSITFEPYGITLDRSELLSDVTLRNVLERKCRSALFEIRYTVLQQQGKNNLDRVLPIL